MKKFKVAYPDEINQELETIVVVSVDGKFSGHFVIADEIKEDAPEAIKQIRSVGIDKIIMLSGDKSSVAQRIAAQIDINEVYGNLLLEDKV
ncbi:MAG: HAD family hydrolase [Flavobacteriales bacterium Tduv]